METVILGQMQGRPAGVPPMGQHQNMMAQLVIKPHIGHNLRPVLFQLDIGSHEEETLYICTSG
jgi:hypothetical protein